MINHSASLDHFHSLSRSRSASPTTNPSSQVLGDSVAVDKIDNKGDITCMHTIRQLVIKIQKVPVKPFMCLVSYTLIDRVQGFSAPVQLDKSTVIIILMI
jgi:hypothetical protein